MSATVEALEAVLDFATEVGNVVNRVDRALPSLRSLLRASGLSFKLVGGVAVVHHGYVRTTRDLDLLLEATSDEVLEESLLRKHGFERLGRRQLRHVATGVTVDLLVAGEPMPRQDSPNYPSPSTLTSSARDPDFVDLPGLIELKLHAARHQDLADVVALLKRLDEGEYLRLEAALPAGLRKRLGELRRDALEELGWEGNDGS